MFKCGPNIPKEFYRSRTKAPVRRKRELAELLRQSPWREVLRSEMLDEADPMFFDDENCSILKAFAKEQQLEGEDKTLQERLECWLKLEELKRTVPELRHLREELLSEEESGGSKVSDSVLPKYLLSKIAWGQKKISQIHYLDATSVATEADVTSEGGKSAVERRVQGTLREALYEDEELARALEGIRHKDILALINFEEDLEGHVQKCRLKEVKEKSCDFFDVSYFATKVMNYITKPDDDSRQVSTVSVSLDDASFPFLDSSVGDETGRSSAAVTPRLQSSLLATTERTGSSEESKSGELSLSSGDLCELEPGDRSDAEFLFDELLGEFNFEDALEDWQNMKRKKNLKEDKSGGEEEEEEEVNS